VVDRSGVAARRTLGVPEDELVVMLEPEGNEFCVA
jgi:hypothetical protein